MTDDVMKTAEDLALRFATLVAQERDTEARLLKIKAEKEDALRKLLAVPANGNSSPSGSRDKEKVFQLLEASPARIFTTAEVSEQLGMAGNVASAYLSDLFNNDKRIARIAKGKYQALALAPPTAWPTSAREVDSSDKSEEPA